MGKINTAILFVAALVSCAAVSCRKDDTLRYGNVTMGNFTDGRFTSDQGNIFDIVEQNCSGDVREMDRAIISCDVLRLVPGTENEYEVRLNQMASVFTKNPVKAGNITDEDMSVENPVHVEALWFAGGYANMYISFLTKDDSTRKHLINLVLEESPAEDGSYVLTLRHNAFGELPQGEDTDFVLAGSYVSFPLSGLFEEEGKVRMTLKWKWYKSAGAWIVDEIEDYSVSCEWDRSGFEQAPSTIASKASADIR